VGSLLPCDTAGFFSVAGGRRGRRSKLAAELGFGSVEALVFESARASAKRRGARGWQFKKAGGPLLGVRAKPGRRRGTGCCTDLVRTRTRVLCEARKVMMGGARSSATAERRGERGPALSRCWAGWWAEKPG
jgi:hypothetical protein